MVISLPDNIYIPEESLDFNIVGDGVSISSIFYPDSETFEEHDVFLKSANIKAILETKIQTKFKIQISYKRCSKKHECSELLTYEQEFEIKPHVEVKKTNLQSISGIESDIVVSEQDYIANLIKNSSFFITIITFFGFGLLLAFTPCMLPVIPILSAVIINNRDKITTKKGFLLSLVYVVSMSVVYAFAGILAASLGSNIQAFFQQPWIIVLFSSLFFILSLAMFGIFSMEMPKSIQTLLSKKSDSSKDRSYYGVAFLGVLSALIIGPCVAPPLAGALIYIGQTGNELVGGLSLFFMSLGMGVPLLLLGAGAGKFIPKPGPWMDDVKLFFGFSLIAFSIWMLSRILDAQTVLFLWGVLLVAIAIFMNPFEDINRIEISRSYQLKKLFSMLCLIIGAVFIMGAVGGAKSVKAPLEPFTSKSAPISTTSGVVFKTISAEQLYSVVRESSKPVMVMFTASWCDNCKELDANVFSKNDVAQELEEFEKYKVDITQNRDIDIELLKRYALFGPPGIIFFDKNHKELKSYRLSGDKEKKVFIEHIRKVKKIL
ncbi:MAG: protein-disulfide reductase DsbD [Sulfurimonas sp.]|nr:protein-disulfide reductase DsbD [Sulfurimonas sp.]